LEIGIVEYSIAEEGLIIVEEIVAKGIGIVEYSIVVEQSIAEEIISAVIE
jgi:hypothetical protein